MCECRSKQIRQIEAIEQSLKAKIITKAKAVKELFLLGYSKQDIREILS